ncbi:MAG: TrkA C-terminal domain-containing protein [Planctomycetota bacterium]|nr:TrkA C-terminal domain-containing protein [Planctomycetota bacterium]
MSGLWQSMTEGTTAAGGVLALAVTISLGLALGSARVRRLQLGVAGVLFAGLILGHFGVKASPPVLEFAREFGLILFVYAVGLTVGPGFFNSFKRGGARLNALAAAIVLSGGVLAVGLGALAGLGGPATAGMFCGSTTNTPALAAAGQVLRERLAAEQAGTAVPGADAAGAHGEAAATPPAEHAGGEVTKIPWLAYAVTYPFGVAGVLLTMVVLRRAFACDPQAEAARLRAEAEATQPTLRRMSLRVTNPNLDGLGLSHLPGLRGSGVVVSRLVRGADVSVPGASTPLRLGDVLLAVGEPAALEQLRVVVGEVSVEDPMEAGGDVLFRWLTISRRHVVGRTVEQLGWGARFGVRVTRVRRAGVEMSGAAPVTLGLGDQVLVVGTESSIQQAVREAGDSPRRLEHTELAPIFIGIVLGVIVGSIPLAAPGLPAGLKLGLAGGPLLTAMVLSRLQRIGPLVWYVPRSANLVLKDVGIVLFLASVGLSSGDRFVQSLAQGDGPLWLLLGAVVTLLPPMVVGGIAIAVLRIPYLTVSGLLAGSMTDPPSLAFATSQADSDAPAVAYATVYPLAMILRVVCAQVMVMLAVL